MTAAAAWREGVRRVARAPMLVLGAWTISLALSVPLALVLRDMIVADLRDSLVADAVASGVNWGWWQEFTYRATGIGTTFVPSIVGFAAVLRNISDLADNMPMARAIAGAVTAWLVVWSFVSGGMLDRLARNRRVGAPAFFQAAGALFFRFLRLGIVAWLLYALLFGLVHGWLFERLFGWVTREIALERTTFAIRVLFYGLFLAMLVLVNVVLDYARVRIVVEDRRSALGALAAGARFVARHRRRTIALYALNTATFLALAGIWFFIAPGGGFGGLAQWAAFLLAQAYIVARLWMKLLFYASQTALFQAELAHADYSASTVPEWPESPAAEAIAGG